MVEKCERAIEVTYTSTESSSRNVYLSAPGEPKLEQAREYQFQVLTPAFFSRLVHYQSLREALDCEVTAKQEHNQTARVSDPELLQVLTVDGKETDIWYSPTAESGRAVELSWQLLFHLRSRPTAPLYPNPGIPSTRGLGQPLKDADIPTVQARTSNARAPSTLDGFVRHHCHSTEQSEYRRALTRLFLSERVTFGSTGLFMFCRILVHIAVLGLSMYASRKLGANAAVKAGELPAMWSTVLRWNNPVHLIVLCWWSWISLERKLL